MTNRDRLRIKLEAWRDSVEFWLIVAGILVLALLAWCQHQ